MRRYADPVEVKARGGHGAAEGVGNIAGAVPDSFLWRGRLYVVRSVLGHWRERRAWWTEPAARALHGESVPTVSGARGLGAGGLEAEQEVWRVEASAGRRAGVGVYDLCRNQASAWLLLRVSD